MFPHTLYDDFTVKGLWWVPGDEGRRVAGELVVKAGADIELTVYGTLSPVADPRARFASSLSGHDPIPVIWGQLVGGTPITLFDNMWASCSTGSTANVQTTYTPSVCAFGLWYHDDHEDFRLAKLVLRLTHLEDWINVLPFQSNSLKETFETGRVSVSYQPPPAFEVAVADPPMTFKVGSFVNQNSEAMKSETLTHISQITLTPHKPLTLDAAFELMSDVQKLFTLLVGEQVFVKRMAGSQTINVPVQPRLATAPTDPESSTAVQRTEPKTVEVDIIFSQSDQRPPKRGRAHQMTMPKTALGEGLGETVQRWFDSLGKFRPLYNVFFGMYRNDRMYSESKFLHLAQVIESFHRETVGGQYVSEDTYKPIKDHIISHFPPDLDSGLRDRLKSQVRFANQPALRTRLRNVLKNLIAEERAIICVDADDFIKAVVDTRNYLTHLDRHEGAIILDGHERYLCSKSLELLITVVILKNLGVPSSVIVEQATACQRFAPPFKLRGSPSGESSNSTAQPSN